MSRHHFRLETSHHPETHVTEIMIVGLILILAVALGLFFGFVTM